MPKENPEIFIKKAGSEEIKKIVEKPENESRPYVGPDIKKEVEESLFEEDLFEEDEKYAKENKDVLKLVDAALDKTSEEKEAAEIAKIRRKIAKKSILSQTEAGILRHAGEQAKEIEGEKTNVSGPEIFHIKKHRKKTEKAESEVISDASEAAEDISEKSSEIEPQVKNVKKEAGKSSESVPGPETKEVATERTILKLHKIPTKEDIKDLYLGFYENLNNNKELSREFRDRIDEARERFLKKYTDGEASEIFEDISRAARKEVLGSEWPDKKNNGAEKKEVNWQELVGKGMLNLYEKYAYNIYNAYSLEKDKGAEVKTREFLTAKIGRFSSLVSSDKIVALTDFLINKIR